MISLYIYEFKRAVRTISSYPRAENKKQKGEKTKMNIQKISLGLLLMTVAMVVVPEVTAQPQYLAPLQTLYGSSLSCGTCHVNPNGGGPRNAYGTLFENIKTHASDPTGALKAIGSPIPPVTTPPVTTPPVTTPPVTTPPGSDEGNNRHYGEHYNSQHQTGEHHTVRHTARNND